MNPVDWLGFFGVSLILMAYYLNSTGRISTKHLSFILLNFIGALVACLASVLLEYIPFVILEGVWAFISLQALITYMKSTKNV